MVEHCSADPATSCFLGGVHRLQLCVLLVETLQRTDCEELTVGRKL
jgi:hypothetical protein